MTETTWNDFHSTVLSKLSKAIPCDFKIAPDPDATRGKGTRPPSNFDLHFSKANQIRFVKWSPSLIEQGMEKLRTLHPDDTPASDPGAPFWIKNNIDANIASLSRRDIVTGENRIQTLVDGRILPPLCSIISRILFHLDAEPCGEEQYYEYEDLITQTGDQGPPIWDTFVKISAHNAVAKQVIPALIDRIIFALELKSLSIASSSFFSRLCSRAAANSSFPPKKFGYEICKKRINCPHYRAPDVRQSPDATGFFENLTALPDFNPNDDELTQLIADIRTINDDESDELGPINLDDSDSKSGLALQPRAHLALAIIRSEARVITQDMDVDTDSDDLQECEDWTRKKGDEFEEHYSRVLRKVTRYLYQFRSTNSIGLGLGGNGSQRSHYFSNIYFETCCDCLSLTIRTDTICVHTFPSWGEKSYPHSGTAEPNRIGIPGSSGPYMYRGIA
jgi:hypothetical protein